MDEATNDLIISEEVAWVSFLFLIESFGLKIRNLANSVALVLLLFVFETILSLIYIHFVPLQCSPGKDIP